MNVPVGLCQSCHYCRRIETARSAFVLCGRATTDKRYPKYPRLPVLACAGYEARPADEAPRRDAERNENPST